MRFLIYCISFFLLAMVFTIIKGHGIILGGIPTVALYSLTLFIANQIWKAYSKHKAVKVGREKKAETPMPSMNEPPEPDEVFYANLAQEMGTSVSIAKKIYAQEMKLKTENEQHAKELVLKANVFRKIYPDFDLEKELNNETFKKLTSLHVKLDIEPAYYAVHYEDVRKQLLKLERIKKTFWIFLAIASICLVAFLFLFYSGGETEDTSITVVQTAPPQTTQATSEPEIFDHPILIAPKSGHIFERLPEEFCVAPFTVNTANSSGYYFVVKPIEIFHDGSHEGKVNALHCYAYDLRFYAGSNSTVHFEVPLGKYEVFFATGEYWYGEEYLFGPDTVYQKCDEIFEFSIDFENGFTGWTIDLYSTYNGNLDTDIVSADEFPK